MDYNDEIDDDIARAIALSLQYATRKREVIELDSDSEDDEDEDARFETELQRALDASKAEASRQPSQTAPARTVKPITEEPQTQPQTSTAGASSFLSERAQLEKERRERQKRLRPEVARDESNADYDEDEEPGVSEPPAKRQQISSSSGVRANNGRNHPVPSSSYSARPHVPPQNVATIDQVFWNGELRQTANMHAEPRKDGRPTFRLTEVLGKKSDLEFAIMSSYSLDFSWIYEFFDRSVPVIMVAQPDPTGQASLKNVLPNWIKTTPFLRGGRGCMHMKFMLLFYKTGRLRVVISTANLIAYDYRDMENTVWLQDLPLRSKPIPHDPKASEDFPSILQAMLYAINVGPALKTMFNDNHPNLPLKRIEELRMLWDWSNVKVHLMPSIAGRHEGWPSVVKTGHPRLMKIVRNMGMRAARGDRAKGLVLECQGSSLGIYTTQWLNEFHWSARGESAEDWLDDPRKKRERLPYPPVKIIYPTKLTVQQTKLGEQGGGTIFCRRKQWASKNFPRDHFYDSKSKAGPVLMHSKMIIATYREAAVSAFGKRKQTKGSDTEDDSDEDIQVIEPAYGWAYVGSHNFTPSAWGTLSGTGFNPILNISNYEVGIVFPLKDKEEADRIACFERPPRKYAGKDEPWIQEESIYHQNEEAP
ncbi:Tyrosyl-DNA phosphodiesterase 1 [Hypsizygus marmoreus]|uniref:Tyrosyl-DNA phosphodiesterase 1 n=1 Tax=Hypsizygus marmoreus TaxID=39966 RepID=A0A369J7W9_HYPMA|nr:Tyrosyl-DNA phosphodiesterase 1 [Hypsizygus marmoreus]